MEREKFCQFQVMEEEKRVWAMGMSGGGGNRA